MSIKVIDPPAETVNLSKEDSDVVLKVEYGDAQSAQVSRVKLSSASSNLGVRQTVSAVDLDEFNLGLAKDIKGQKLYVNTYLGDASPNTNQVSATYTFTNGSNVVPFPAYAYTVENDYDSIVLRLEFSLQ